MELRQTGPEKDAAGELITNTVAAMEDFQLLTQLGDCIASKHGNENACWVTSPLGSRRATMEVSGEIYLGIDGASRP